MSEIPTKLDSIDASEKTSEITLTPLSAPVASELDIPVVDTDLDKDAQISAISSTPPDSDKRFSIFHYSNQGFAGVMKIARGVETGVKQNKKTSDPNSNLTFGVVPMVGWASEDSFGFEYHIPRNQIAAPGDPVTNLHKFVLNEDGTIGIIGKVDSSHLSMLDYEGEIAICPVTKLSDQQAEQIDKVNHWTEESREKIALPKQRISMALFKLADALKPTDDTNLPSDIRDHSIIESVLNLSVNVTVEDVMNGSIEDRISKIMESQTSQITRLSDTIADRRNRAESLRPILDNMTRSFDASEKGGLFSALSGIKKRGLTEFSQIARELKEKGIAEIPSAKFDPNSSDKEVYDYIKYLFNDNARTLDACEQAQPQLEELVAETKNLITEINNEIQSFKDTLKSIYT